MIKIFRFYVSTSSNSIEKKQNFVHFPIVDFSSVDYVMPSERQRQNSLYNLIAVSNHYGTLNRGHYTAFCQNFGSKQWVYTLKSILNRLNFNFLFSIFKFSDGTNTMIIMSHKFLVMMSAQVLVTFCFIRISKEWMKIHLSIGCMREHWMMMGVCAGKANNIYAEIHCFFTRKE